MGDFNGTTGQAQHSLNQISAVTNIEQKVSTECECVRLQKQRSGLRVNFGLFHVVVVRCEKRRE